METVPIMLILNWGFLLLSLAALVVGMVLTQGRVRLCLGVALALFLCQPLLSQLGAAVMGPRSGLDWMLVFSMLQGVIALGQTGALVAAAVIGARQHTATLAALAAQNDEVPQPGPSPRAPPTLGYWLTERAAW